jgi:hypothetical protein
LATGIAVIAWLLRENLAALVSSAGIVVLPETWLLIIPVVWLIVILGIWNPRSLAFRAAFGAGAILLVYGLVVGRQW